MLSKIIEFFRLIKRCAVYGNLKSINRKGRKIGALVTNGFVLLLSLYAFMPLCHFSQQATSNKQHATIYIPCSGAFLTISWYSTEVKLFIL